MKKVLIQLGLALMGLAFAVAGQPVVASIYTVGAFILIALPNED